MKTWVNILFVVSISCANIKAAEKISKEDYCDLIDKTINLPELQQYYHIKSFPDRIPLVVYTNQFMGGCQGLKKFNVPVKIISSTGTINLGQLQNFKIEFHVIDHLSIKIIFSYVPEGIHGSIKYIKNNSQTWDIENSEIVEM